MAVPKTTLETLKHKINPSAGETAPRAVDVLLYTPGEARAQLRRCGFCGFTDVYLIYSVVFVSAVRQGDPVNAYTHPSSYSFPLCFMMAPCAVQQGHVCVATVLFSNLRAETCVQGVQH